MDIRGIQKAKGDHSPSISRTLTSSIQELEKTADQLKRQLEEEIHATEDLEEEKERLKNEIRRAKYELKELKGQLPGDRPQNMGDNPDNELPPQFLTRDIVLNEHLQKKDKGQVLESEEKGILKEDLDLDYHKVSAQELLERLSTSEKGLSEAAVLQSRKKWGPNLVTPKKPSFVLKGLAKKK